MKSSVALIKCVLDAFLHLKLLVALNLNNLFS